MFSAASFHLGPAMLIVKLTWHRVFQDIAIGLGILLGIYLAHYLEFGIWFDGAWE